MTQKEFQQLSKTLDLMCKDIMKAKGPEYTQEDKDILANFKTIESRFADIINYCHLGLALFKERNGRTLKYLRNNGNV